jgi:iron complex outermembrane recepter protein
MHNKMRRALVASTALATGLLLANAAMAQSTTGSATVEELVVTGSSGPSSMSGIVEQTAPKTRTVIDQDFISRQMPGQTVADSLNVVPGYNFTNNDPYGNSGGNLRLRSFDCARVSLQWDGMQLNDSGNYACFTNQLGDSEIISVADVAQGTTDVDAPSASATGGSINYRTRVPRTEFGGFANLQAGSFAYKRIFALVDSGEIGPWGTRAFVAGSYTNYDKFRGTGELEKKQFNARIYQPLRDNGDFASLAFHWNENRNNFYRNMTLAQFQQFGADFENDSKCIRVTPVAGTAQNESTQNQFVDWTGATGTGSCTNYFNTRINPSDTGNIRGAFKWHLADNLIFTFDPTFQYVLANGGGFTVVSETDGRLRGSNIIVTNATATSGGAAAAGAAGGPGRDLNGDGDTLDNVSIYTPNTTNTRRYGINSSLIWDLAENHRVRVAYAFDRALHRQTGDFGFYDADLNPENVFGGKDGQGRDVPTSDGSNLRGRDRFSIAGLHMFAAEYLGNFMDDRLELRLGVRAPFFKRELNNFCYSVNNSSNVLCTTQPVQATLANGNVLLRGQGTTQYIAPYSAEKKYDKVLPNIGVSYKITDNHSVYVSFAQGLSAPRTDNLYTVSRLPDGSIGNPLVQPETTDTLDLGYRFTSDTLLVSVAAYSSKFKNRIASSFDPDLGIFIDRNIGDVDISGVDAQAVWQPAEYLTWIGNIAYTNAELQSDTQVGNVAGAQTFLPTKGKFLVETPEYSWFNRVEWDINDSLSLAVQAKWVGERWTTDVNDQKVRAYSLVDADLRWQVAEKYYVQFNVKNMFDENYIGSISSTSNAITVPGIGSNGLAPFLTPGSPRTFQVTLHAEF